MSVGWHFPRGRRLDGLSLAIGVAAARAAAAFARERITLKWPNDLLLEDRAKLGGILVETVPYGEGGRSAVIGIGINLRAPQIDAAPGEARDALPAGALISSLDPRETTGPAMVRSALIRALLDELGRALPRFAAHGFAGFRDDWWAQRAYANTRVRIVTNDADGANASHAIIGKIVDVQETGALIVDDGRTLHTLHSGTLSIRPIHA